MPETQCAMLKKSSQDPVQTSPHKKNIQTDQSQLATNHSLPVVTDAPPMFHRWTTEKTSAVFAMLIDGPPINDKVAGDQ